MTDRTVIHDTFTIERDYPVPLNHTWSAWADPAIKGRWFASAAGQEHELDFRAGGLEITRGTAPDGTAMVFESTYRDIVAPQRIVYTSTLSGDDELLTVSLTTVLFTAAGDATHLTLVEQATFLDGHEKPEWRSHGTGAWLDALGADLAAVTT
jgi:uncharacterized protein YndB with AHSA1/START domain